MAEELDVGDLVERLKQYRLVETWEQLHDLVWEAATALETRTPAIPEGYVMVPRERIEALETGLRQYRNDMMWPPEADSRERRIAMIDALIGGAP